MEYPYEDPYFTGGSNAAGYGVANQMGPYGDYGNAPPPSNNGYRGRGRAGSAMGPMRGARGMSRGMGMPRGGGPMRAPPVSAPVSARMMGGPHGDYFGGAAAPVYEQSPLDAEVEIVLNEMHTEIATLDQTGEFGEQFKNARRLLSTEVERLENNIDPEWLEVDVEKPIKLIRKVLIPTFRHPRFNYVGKVLGPRGTTLQNIAKQFKCHVYILGRGSTRDRAKEEELLNSGDPNYAHYAGPLHVKIETNAPPALAYQRVSGVLEVLQQLLQPIKETHIPGITNPMEEHKDDKNGEEEPHEENGDQKQSPDEEKGPESSEASEMKMQSNMMPPRPSGMPNRGPGAPRGMGRGGGMPRGPMRGRGGMIARGPRMPRGGGPMGGGRGRFAPY
ncbi:KH domain-containing protein [Aphelenchoides besseyi]|nr:KH domain-containing protein [Aphelenchoides besseyi]KAI6218955.1 KH domain-containing protein [Aphelenchoides besseyi]